MSAIIPPAKTQFLDSLGRPLTGGLVYTYAQGTTSPKATYKDRALTISNTNPVTLDASGSAAMWGTGAYSMVVANSVGSVILTGDSFADNFDGTAVTITGGTIDGTNIGATTPGTGKFTSLTITGGIDGTNLGLTTPAQAAFTSLTTTGNAVVGGNGSVSGTLTVTGQATVPAAASDTSAVNRGQVKGIAPISAQQTATAATTVTATTASFTAPTKGFLVINAHGLCDTANRINGLTMSATLAGIVTQQTNWLGMTSIGLAYLPMNSGDVTTVSAVQTASAASNINLVIRAFFQPAP